MSESTARLARVGVVAIGRNEGERLRRCFDSLPTDVGALVYVDSGSSDGSVALARARGHQVVELDMSRPFTAARARNAGFEALSAKHPEISEVQFVDGDCALAEGWLLHAAEALDRHPDVAAVWGRRRELEPERSVYNELCDIEWSQEPLGETQTFGGDVMVRVSVVREVNGYNPGVIAGEDPDFAVRVRQRGHRILRIDAEMTRHDAALTHFRQWWIRTKRSGYAYAQVSALHANNPERFWRRESQRALFWGMLLPLGVLALAPPTLGLSSLLLGAYPLRASRVARRSAQQRGLRPSQARHWAMHCIGASFPQAFGILQYHSERMRGKVPTLIEYK